MPKAPSKIQTYYVVQRVEKTPRGGYRTLPPIQAKDHDHCVRLAHRYAALTDFVVAFSRRADFEMGEYEDAVILLTLGVPPEDFETLMAA